MYIKARYGTETADEAPFYSFFTAMIGISIPLFRDDDLLYLSFFQLTFIIHEVVTKSWYLWENEPLNLFLSIFLVRR